MAIPIIVWKTRGRDWGVPVPAATAAVIGKERSPERIHQLLLGSPATASLSALSSLFCAFPRTTDWNRVSIDSVERKKY